MTDYYNKYLRYKLKYLNLKKKSITNMQGGGLINDANNIMLFKAEWCTYCKKFNPTWNELEQQFKSKNLRFKVYDSEQDKIEHMLYNINSYPTIIMNINGKKIDFDGNRTKEELEKFINNNLK